MATKQRSFWSSTTGFVTGVAGVLTAVAGILGAGTQLGWFSSDGNGGTRSGVETTESTAATGQSGGTTAGGSTRQAPTTPTFTVDPLSLSFDTLNRKKTVTVDNTGTSPITVEAPKIDGTQRNAFSASGCSRALAAGVSCEIEVTFDPPSSGTHRARLVVQVTGAPAEEVALSGTALLP